MSAWRTRCTERLDPAVWDSNSRLLQPGETRGPDLSARRRPDARQACAVPPSPGATGESSTREEGRNGTDCELDALLARWGAGLA